LRQFPRAEAQQEHASASPFSRPGSLVLEATR
jgi:hypothetical protein